METFLTNRTQSTIMQEINEVEKGMRNLITEGQVLMEACNRPKGLTERQAKAIVERKKEFSEKAYSTLHTMKTSGFFGRLHDHFIIERLELFAERDKPTLPERMRRATEEERDEWVENRRNEVNQRLADLEEDELDLIQEHLEMVDQIEYIYHELFMS